MGYDWKKGAGEFLSVPAKRLMEKVYDEFSKTELGKQLKELGKLEKLSMDGVLGLLMVYADQKIPEDNFFLKLFKETFKDSGSEISKRYHNNENLNQAASDFKKAFLDSLLSMEKGEIKTIIDWVNALDDSKKTDALKQVSKLDAEKLRKVTELKPEYREKLVDIFGGGFYKPKGLLEELEESLGPVADALEKSLEEKKKRRGRNV